MVHEQPRTRAAGQLPRLLRKERRGKIVVLFAAMRTRGKISDKSRVMNRTVGPAPCVQQEATD